MSCVPGGILLTARVHFQFELSAVREPLKPSNLQYDEASTIESKFCERCARGHLGHREFGAWVHAMRVVVAGEITE
jgi:hypothetical protein